jgi:hypothetical protein
MALVGPKKVYLTSTISELRNRSKQALNNLYDM